MTERFIYRFDWNISKAMTNWHKHGVSFRLAATVFRDPLALSRYDFEHSQSEERWITLGQAETGQLIVVVHTFEELAAEARIRIISARYATARERRQYQSS
ncbi:MAG TPA: BrnT family toxin [Steroidobacteraceae bacterium]|nr:BrnT family toxin [Steroidobacteraceae bacterium]